MDMADHDVCTILDGESVAALAGTVLPYERTLYRAFYLGFYPDNGPIVLIGTEQNASTLLPSDLNHATLHHVTTFVWTTSLPTKSELFFSQRKSVLNFSCFFPVSGSASMLILDPSILQCSTDTAVK